ncbi:MAG TPA: VOC family protein [Gammaproteobacteria bacterium]|nr:VOC family protein [Gammaproteobacteria bacterium]
MTFQTAVPVLQVSNVAKSVRWYEEVLGFEAWTFPEEEPYSFALLSRDTCELMLQLSRETPVSQGWAAYVRVTGSSLLDLAEQVRASVPLSREPERMPHCDVEFSVTDPDGHEIVLSERLDDEASVPSVKEG